MAYYSGQWVCFEGEYPGAHQTPDGRVVGIYQRATTDGTGEATPDRIMVVDADGGNIPTIKDGSIVNVQADPAVVEKLEPIADVAHLPAKRVSHLPADFVLLRR